MKTLIVYQFETKKDYGAFGVDVENKLIIQGRFSGYDNLIFIDVNMKTYRQLYSVFSNTDYTNLIRL